MDPGYILTISVHAYTFGQYVVHLREWEGWLPRFLAVTVIAMLVLVNLREVGDSSKLEIVTVWGKLFILLGLSVFGILNLNPELLTSGIGTKPLHMEVVKTATKFMAYPGFQLLPNDYRDIKEAKKTFPGLPCQP